LGLAGHRHEVVCVVGGGHAGRHHVVVAGPFALKSEPCRPVPDERIHPVNRTRQLADEACQEVVALQVREFMEQNGPPTLLAPLPGGRGKEDHRTKDAERQWYRNFV